MSNNRRKSKATEEMLSRQAREDYYRLGLNRSVKQLFETYKAKAKAGRRDEVPTLNYPTLTGWRKNQDWDSWCAQRHEEETELDNVKIRAKRDRALNLVTLLIDDAFSEWGRMINDPTTPATVKAKLIEMVRDTVITKEKEDKATGRDLPTMPDANASEEEKREWLQLVN